MTNNEKAIEPLLIAIKAEKSAIEYYARAARRVTNPTGKKALEKIKKQEEAHYKALKLKFRKLTGRDVRPEDEAGVSAQISPLTEAHIADREASDLDICQVALQDEREAHNYYLKSAQGSSDSATIKLYEELAGEEKKHAETIAGLCRILSGKK
ncbi:hypothetical protein A2625_06900 [candidate division WOR-1 bacterium RIFCSPHIGHO2_01_FULL_53_15]|uniref:Uncharacterized protein n=1 Tax=candidate division WOR-1 bacterium RIFCSPHIGHO2_01_FULL_53_15 TaxID=1802564 RepID=A0A1F4Q586_UNCSA|nr:MAG: hypothetical protein A2625_06900 [candidate division WOR-1 bacterium RIFCSPHIGHO2_01_FULL_53_15]OGC10331.1 MAG: hypothetical protein A3D23_06915 [candidate division WOR-1 bacterium RIFCSPHIGHO2_02_FULL_53_26]